MVTDIVFSSEEIDLGIDDTETIVADVLPEDADNKRLRWSSDSPSIVSVTVDEDTHSATVKGVSEGEAIITAAATDGSGVSAMCNVKVSGTEPYPENADMYVKSVQSFNLTTEGTGADQINTFALEAENGDIIHLRAITNPAGTGSYKVLSIYNSTTGEETIVDFQDGISNYVIGSLKDKSYLSLYQTSDTSTIRGNLYYSEIADYADIAFNEYSKTFYRVTIYYYNDDIARECTTNTNKILRYAKDKNSYGNNINGIYNGYYYNSNRVRTTYTIPETGLLIKVTAINNGVTKAIDYVYMGSARFFKIQKSNGEYIYTNSSGHPIPPEQFPPTPEDQLELTFTY